MTAYYNEHDRHAAAWLRELIKEGHIAHGDVDERDIQKVKPDDIRHYTQVHFFAGIGGWSLALRLAGWPDDRRVWTGSCPCQPFSAAGKGLGTADERHLWPVFAELIRACEPPVTLGEQVASKAGREWLAGVFADLEAMGHQRAGADLCAAGVGAPHIRQRLFWLAYAEHAGHDRSRRVTAIENRNGADGGIHRGSIGGAADTANENWQRVMFQSECDPDGDGWCKIRDCDPAECDCIGPTQDGIEYIEKDGTLYGRWMGNTSIERLDGHTGDVVNRNQPGRLCAKTTGPIATPGLNSWSDFALIPCGDGKTRRIKRGLEPLVDGVPARVVRLRGYGNAIVPQVAATFIEEVMACIAEMEANQ